MDEAAETGIPLRGTGFFYGFCLRRRTRGKFFLMVGRKN